MPESTRACALRSREGFGRARRLRAPRNSADDVPNAACVVTLVDRLMHKSEIVTIDGDSYRLREAEERQRERASARKRREGSRS